MGDLSKNFSSYEFQCRCGCGRGKMSPSLIEQLQMAREILGTSIDVESGIRCAGHNKKIGGVPGSAHVPADLNDNEGEVSHAVDLRVLSSSKRFALYDGARAAGISRIGIGRNFLHLDNDTRKPDGVAFDYYQGGRHVA